MTTSFARARVAVFLAFLTVSALTGASCQPANYSSGPGGMMGSGPSSNIAPIPGTGAMGWYSGSTPPGTISGPLLVAINSYRQSIGLNALTWHDGMASVTGIHHLDMLNQGYFSIVNPQGVDVYERMVSSGPRIDFDNAFAICLQFPAGSTSATLLQSLLSNTVTRSVIENASITHFASTMQGGVGTMIFAVNARP